MKEKEIIGDPALKRLGEVMGFGEKTKPDLVASVKPKETSGAEAIAPLFENIIGLLCEGNSCDACVEKNREDKDEQDPCKGCDGDTCPHLKKDGFTCVAIEGLKVIPSAADHYCKDCDGVFCPAQGLPCSGDE